MGPGETLVAEYEPERGAVSACSSLFGLPTGTTPAGRDPMVETGHDGRRKSLVGTVNTVTVPAVLESYENHVDSCKIFLERLEASHGHKVDLGLGVVAHVTDGMIALPLFGFKCIDFRPLHSTNRIELGDVVLSVEKYSPIFCHRNLL